VNNEEQSGDLGRIADLAGDRSSGFVGRVLRTAREELGMEMTFVGEFVGDRLAFRALSGDAGSFRFSEGGDLPLEGTFCQRVVEGRLPGVVPDARGDERVMHLDVTRESGIGSYVGIPLRFSDGRLYGTVCCLSHEPDPDLRERDARFMGVLARLISEQLEREEMERTNRRLEAQAAGAGALLAALEARDGYTGEHSRAVVELSVAVARRLGLPEEEVADVEQAALLHDVGKLGVPDALLNKPGPLDPEEQALMRRHPVIGERIVSSLEGLAHLAPAIRAEHERWDGLGYPDGLAGEEIPPTSRIVFACGAFHAMISDRPYRRAMGFRRAVEELRAGAGTQFCPRTTEALLGVLEERGADRFGGGR
jgi:response regulator RpfG family c-di-GMP phosphodiesterase